MPVTIHVHSVHPFIIVQVVLPLQGFNVYLTLLLGYVFVPKDILTTLLATLVNLVYLIVLPV